MLKKIWNCLLKGLGKKNNLEKDMGIIPLAKLIIY